MIDQATAPIIAVLYVLRLVVIALAAAYILDFLMRIKKK
jgi:hypothetical protein